jgi:hypothetical protein
MMIGESEGFLWTNSMGFTGAAYPVVLRHRLLNHSSTDTSGALM